MDPDEETAGGDVEDVNDTGAGEDTGDTGADQPGGSAAGEQTPPGQQPAAPRERIFNQAQVNAFLAEERRKWEASAARRAATPAAPARPAGGESRRFDPATQAALDAYFQERTAPFREAQVKVEINEAFENFRAVHPEFATKETRDAVIAAILELGEEFVQQTPMDKLLDYGWLKYKYGNFNEEEFSKKVIADHLAGKGAQARKTGTPQGAGGKATTNPKPTGKGDWKDTDSLMKQLIDEENAARA